MKQPLKIIIVGGNSAGPAAAARAKRLSPASEVLMIEAGNYISTGTCEMPYVLSGKIKSYEDVIFYTPQSFFNKKGVKVLARHKVERVDRKNKILEVFDVTENTNKKIEYDKLILATGSVAKTLPALLPGLKNVFSFKTISDLITLQKFIYSVKPQNAVVVGAGYLGLEIAEALNEKNMNVTLIDVKDVPMSSADSAFSKRILSIIQKHDINFIGSVTEIEPFIKNDSLISLKINGNYIKPDMIVYAIGFEANTILAKEANIITGKSGGIKTDPKLRTNDPNIFAAGDATEVINAITGKPEFIPLAGHAYQQGHIAGENSAGGNLLFDQVVKNISVKIFDNFYSAVGLSYEEAKLNGFNSGSVSEEFYNLVKVMPGAKNIFVNLTFDKDSGRILGGQLLGDREISGYADLLSALIKLKENVKILDKINFNYTPPLSPFNNPLNTIGRIIKKKK